MEPARRTFPDDAVIGHVDSPTFTASYPRLINGDLIPPPLRAAMETAWSTACFPGRDVRIVRLRDVWVAHEGLVFDADGALFAETVTQHSPGEIEHAFTAVRAAMADPPPCDDAGPVLLCKKRGVGNYGHWMIEMLPRVHLLHARMPDLALRPLVATAEGRLAESMALSLQGLGVDPARVIAAGNEPRRFAELVIVDGLSEHGVFVSPLILDALGTLAQPIAPAAHPKLLVLRRAAGCRMLTDEEAIIRVALERGYTVIEPGLLPLSEQIALFKGARRIVGIMGAAMTNVVFAAPETPVVTLAPAGMPDTFFWFLSALRGLDYTEVRCPQTGAARGPTAWDTDLVLDPALFDTVFGA